jgi:hypothetical protein
MGSEGTVPLDEGEWSASLPGRLTPEEISPGTHGIEGLVGSMAGVGAVECRRIFCPYRESNSCSSARCPPLFRLVLHT